MLLSGPRRRHRRRIRPPVFLDQIALTLPALGEVTLFADAYFGWGISIYGMLAGLVLTVGASLVTAHAPETCFEGLVA